MAQVHDIVAAPDSRPYELLLEIGSGGMADVFLGRAVGAGGFERHVAVKVCHVRLAKDPAFRAMFLDEARLAARIHHRNVVGMLDVGAEKELFLVMEYVEGASFTELVELAERRGERMPVDVVLRVLVDLLAGLHAAHETTSADGQNLGIVHRDVSGQNILVGADGASRILDFGVAKALARSATTKEGQVKGKIAYMPPEYLHTREVGRFTDVYSAAVVAWEALAGCSLFMGETEGQTVASVMRAQVPSLRDVRPEVSEAVEKVLRRAMNRDWRQRFATAAEFSGALEAAGAPIATHDRVGAFVQTVAGASLEERRQRVRASERNTPLGLPLQARAAASDSVASEPSTVTPRRVGARAVGAGVAMLLAALALVLWWNAARTPPEDSPSEAGAVVPEAGPAANVEPVRGADDRRAPIDPDSVEATPSAAGDSTGVDAGDVAAKPAQNAVSSPRRRGRTQPKPRTQKKKEWLPSDI
ncbi:MAG: protein kinase [Polyangiales bacterium]|nr:protein kinase [Myxococcales bacterium]